MIPTYLIIDPKWQDIFDRDQEIDRLRGELRTMRDKALEFTTTFPKTWSEWYEDSRQEWLKAYRAETDRLCSGPEKGGEK